MILDWWVEGKNDRVPCLQEINALKIAVEVGLVVGWSRRQLRLAPAISVKQWRHLLKWHQLSWCGAYCYNVLTSEQVLRRLVSKTHDQFLHLSMKEQAHRVRQSSYRCFRYNRPVTCSWFNLRISSSATALLHNSSTCFSAASFFFFQVREFISHFDAPQCLKPYPFLELFHVFRKFSRIV